jgi:DNA-directed RNA polymerase subunit RPC12/RpoP
MCRYAGKTYKSHYACFKCRKSFKQTDSHDIYLRLKKEMTGSLKGDDRKLSELYNEIENRLIKCPECGNVMADLGRELKAPKKTAVKEWKIIEGLYKIGKHFHTCGCDGIGYIPQNPKDYEVYLKNMLEEYRKHLISEQNKTESEVPDKMERINYWVEKISKIKTEIISQKFELS